MKLAILCSGQAGQHRAMLDNMIDAPDLPFLRDIASEILGEDFKAWWRKLSDQDIFANTNAQFAIALYQLSVWQRIAPLIPQPAVVAGYSLGELIAYHVAGALDVASTLLLVRQRAHLMDEAAKDIAVSGGCLLLWRGRVSSRMQEALQQRMVAYGLDTAIVRSSGEQVLAGPADSIIHFMEDPLIVNPNMIRLAVTTPSHSHYLASAAKMFKGILDESPLVSPCIPVLSGVDASRVTTRDQGIEALSCQISRTLRWDRCMVALEEAGIDTVIELGPGNDLAKLVEGALPRVSARSMEDFRDWNAIKDWIVKRSE